MSAHARVCEADVDPQFVARWSPRAFAPTPVEPRALRTLFEAARWAPSAFNAQPWLFIYHQDQPGLDRARALLQESNRAWAARAPVLIFVFARKRDPASGRLLRTGSFDTGAAWFALALQAARLGLVTRAMGGIQHEATYDAFGVSRDEYESMACIALGHPGTGEDLPPGLADRESPSQRRKVETFAFEGVFRAAD